MAHCVFLIVGNLAEWIHPWKKIRNKIYISTQQMWPILLWRLITSSDEKNLFKRKREIEGKKRVCNIQLADLSCWGRTPYIFNRFDFIGPELFKVFDGFLSCHTCCSRGRRFSLENEPYHLKHFVCHFFLFIGMSSNGSFG